MKQKLEYLFLIFFLFSCNSKQPPTRNIKLKKDTVSQSGKLSNVLTDAIDKDSVLINQTMDKISNITEVKEIASKIEKNTNGKHSVSMMVENGFEGDSSLYCFQVGDNSSTDRFVNIYNFILEKKTGEIKVLDPATDSILSLKEWRKKRSAH